MLTGESETRLIESEEEQQQQQLQEGNIFKMAMTYRGIASASGALAVLLGAFGAHAIKARVSADDMEIWKTASTYHFIHTLAIFANSRTAKNAPPMALLSNRLFIAGMLVFSGSLYALVLTQQRKLGAITPIGGLMLVGGWVALAYESSSA